MTWHSDRVGTPVKNVFFIRTGDCIVTKSTVLTEKAKPIQVVVGILRRYEYFGEEGIGSIEAAQSHATSMVSDLALSTIRASKAGEVEVGIMSCYDAKNKISTITVNPMHIKSDGEVRRLHKELLVKKAWEKQKTRFFDRMARTVKR